MKSKINTAILFFALFITVWFYGSATGKKELAGIIEAGGKNFFRVEYKTIKVDGLDIFYREAGNPSKPTIILLHGFPSSSHMYRNLIKDLAGNYHVIAPDYPGFGQSSMPSPSQYEYTFDNLSFTIEHFINALKIKKTTLYMQDYGGPVGMRIAVRNPELIQALIIQNANAYLEGLGEVLNPLTAYIENSSLENEKAARFFLTAEATKYQYLTGAENPQNIDPDSYVVDQYYLDRKGNDAIQLALFRNYGTNIALYENWHQYFKKFKPSMLIVWGKNDQLFVAAGAQAYKKDNPKADVHLFNGGHFVLEEHHFEIAKLIINFLDKTVK